MAIKFKPGDKIRRIGSDYYNVEQGKIYTLFEIRSIDEIKLIEIDGLYDPRQFSLVERKVSIIPWL